MQRKKKKWSKPELIVLIKTRPEEAILAGCKTGVGGASGPVASPMRCFTFCGPPCGRISPCSTIAIS